MAELFANNQNTNDVIDISLDSSKRKRFRIDKDDNRIIELDTTDLNIVDRFQKKYNELVTLIEESFRDLSKSEDPDFGNVGESIANVDAKMRQIMDEIFNSNISEICAPYGSMLDPINGKFRFEYIFETLIPLYENDINSELRKLNTRVQKHTSKYIK